MCLGTVGARRQVSDICVWRRLGRGDRYPILAGVTSAASIFLTAIVMKVFASLVATGVTANIVMAYVVMAYIVMA